MSVMLDLFPSLTMSDIPFINEMLRKVRKQLEDHNSDALEKPRIREMIAAEPHTCIRVRLAQHYLGYPKLSCQLKEKR